MSFYIVTLLARIYMLVLKRSFGKGNKKLKGENRKVKTTATRAKYKNDMWRKWHFWHFDIIKSAENVNNATLRN